MQSLSTTRSVLVVATVAALVGSAMIAAPASASESRISDAQGTTITSAMNEAGVSASTQDVLIAKLRSGQMTDSERQDATPTSITESPLPGGGVSRVATFTDGSQRVTSEVPITAGIGSDRTTTFTTYECNLTHCTALLSRAQTKQMASGAATASAVVAAICGPAAWACAIGIGLMLDTAKRAVSQNRCAGIRRLTTAAPVWPVIEPCRQ